MLHLLQYHLFLWHLFARLCTPHRKSSQILSSLAFTSNILTPHTSISTIIVHKYHTSSTTTTTPTKISLTCGSLHKQTVRTEPHPKDRLHTQVRWVVLDECGTADHMPGDHHRVSMNDRRNAARVLFIHLAYIATTFQCRTHYGGWIWQYPSNGTKVCHISLISAQRADEVNLGTMMPKRMSVPHGSHAHLTRWI